MSRSNRCCKAGRRTRQHHGGPTRGRLILSRAVAFLLLVTSNTYSQSLLRIQILDGEGTINSAGSKSERPIAVRLTDETGRPLEGVAVSFRLPEEGPSGAFEGGMKTDIAITAPDGRAAVHGIRWNRIAGALQVRVTAAKGESRAGTICSQYISDTPVAKSPKSGGGGKRKWVVLAALAGGGAAAGLALGKRSATQKPAEAPPVATQPVQIGLPTISIGKP